MKLHQIILRGHYLYFGYYWLYSRIMDRKIGNILLDRMIDNHDYCNGPVDSEWHPVQSTSYRLLVQSIKYIYVNEDDVFVDVGCGFGRVISYLIIKKRKCRYVGIDINQEAVGIAQKRFQHRNDVKIIRDNVLHYLPADTTILYLFNPFGAEVLHLFLERTERLLHHKVRLIYLNPVHHNVFLQHPKWHLQEEITLRPKFHKPINMFIYEMHP